MTPEAQEPDYSYAVTLETPTDQSATVPKRLAQEAGVKGARTPSRSQVWLRGAVPIGLGIALWITPTPAGLNPMAWHYFALFATVIAAQITEPLPGAATTLIGVCIAALVRFVGKTPAEATKWSLSGFSNETVWLIAAATIFALGYEATGLGRRVALLLVKVLGKRTLGLGYALAAADLILSPFNALEHRP